MRALALLAAVLALAAPARADDEPSAGGRPLSAWIAVVRDERWNTEARDRLREIGAPAVAPLLELLRGDDETARDSAGWILQEMGPNAAAAVPTLVEALATDENRRVRWALAATLGSIGEPAVAAVRALFVDAKRSRTVRAWAARALELIGPAAAPAVPDLAAELASKDPSMRLQVAQALAGIGSGAAAAVPALARALDDPDEAVAARAGRALARVGEPARAAIDRLGVRLHDPRAEVREGAALALASLGDDRQGVVRALALALRTQNGFERDDAAEALGVLAPRSKSARAALRIALADTDPMRHDSRSLEAALALLRAGDLGDDVVRTLVAWSERGVHAGSRDLGKEATEALAPHRDRVVPILAERLAGKETRWRAADRLAEMGTPGAAALIAALRATDDVDAQRTIVEALAKAGAAASDAVPDLQRLAGSSDTWVASGARKALYRIGAGSGAYGALLTKGTVKSRVDAIYQMRPDRDERPNPAAVGALVEALRARVLAVRLAAVQTLALCGESAVPALVAALADPVQSVREDAADALAQMQDDPTAAVLPLLEHADPDVRAAAEHALLSPARPPTAALVEVLAREWPRAGPERRPAVMRWLQMRSRSGPGPALPLLRVAVADEDPKTVAWALSLLRFGSAAGPADAETAAAVARVDPRGDAAIAGPKAHVLDVLAAPAEARVAAWVEYERLRGGGDVADFGGQGFPGPTFDAEAVPALLRAVRDPEPAVRAAATGWLGATAVRTPETVEAVRTALADEAALVRAAAGDAFAALGSRELRDVDLLLELARRHPPPEPDGAAALRAIAVLAPATSSVLDALVAAAVDAPLEVGDWRAALSELAAREEAARLMMLAMLHEDEAGAGVALDALLGVPSVKIPLVDLVALTRPGHTQAVRVRAVRAIGHVRPPVVEALSVLEPLLADADRLVAAAAVVAASVYETDAAGLLPTIEALLASGAPEFEDGRVQQAVARIRGTR